MVISRQARWNLKGRRRYCHAGFLQKEKRRALQVCLERAAQELCVREKWRGPENRHCPLAFAKGGEDLKRRQTRIYSNSAYLYLLLSCLI